jgi:hypothetical protein
MLEWDATSVIRRFLNNVCYLHSLKSGENQLVYLYKINYTILTSEDPNSGMYLQYYTEDGKDNRRPGFISTESTPWSSRSQLEGFLVSGVYPQGFYFPYKGMIYVIKRKITRSYHSGISLENYVIFPLTPTQVTEKTNQGKLFAACAKQKYPVVCNDGVIYSPNLALTPTAVHSCGVMSGVIGTPGNIKVNTTALAENLKESLPESWKISAL